jgi:hypothetical protein
MVSEVVEIAIDGELVLVTSEHPFLTTSGWKTAAMLRPGDEVVDVAGSGHRVSDVIRRSLPERVRVCTLTVAGSQTFVVGDRKYVVHNKPP